jgi:hypothetical protein
MRPIVRGFALFLVVAVAALVVSDAAATPDPDGVVIKTRIFNDNPGSTVSTSNAYPGSIVIEDTGGLSGGFANLHNWHFAVGGTEAAFNNGDAFRWCATLTLSGSGNCEGGLQLSPWWSQDVDGRFNCRTTDGEIACFGGRLPFYSFTGNQGLHYVKGTPITLEIIYLPNGLSMASPATIEYKLTYGGTPYTSGVLPFDQANPAEDPPHGLWGCLNDARAGGYVQAFVAGDPVFATGSHAEWTDVCYENLSVIPTDESSWGKIKSLYQE